MNECVSFSQALEMLKAGYKMARKGWNGKKMCIYYVNGSSVPYSKMSLAVRSALVCARSSELNLDNNDPVIRINPHVDLVCADGSITCGWVASQTDMMSNDWHIVQ